MSEAILATSVLSSSGSELVASTASTASVGPVALGGAPEAFRPAIAISAAATDGPSNAVPEPSAFALFGLGLGAVAMGLRA
jgi:hypothetical protein